MVKHTQTIRRLLPTNYLSVFNQVVGLALKEFMLAEQGFRSFSLRWSKFSLEMKKIALIVYANLHLSQDYLTPAP